MSSISEKRAIISTRSIQYIKSKLKENYVYIVPEHRWLYWNKIYWVDANERVLAILEEAFQINEVEYDVDKKSITKNIQSSFAKYETDINSKHLLVVKNGIIDFQSKYFTLNNSDDGSWFRSHEDFKDKLITMCINAKYNLTEKTIPTKYLKLINEAMVNDCEAASFFHLMDASCLVGGNPLDRFQIYWGPGRNGKTVSLNIKRALFGSYSGTLSPYTLRARSQEYLNDLFLNRKKRLMIVDEFNHSTVLDTSLLKRISGRNRFPLKKSINTVTDYSIDFKVIFDTNHLPKVSSAEALGYWERIIILPFQDAVPVEKRDTTLEQSIIDTELDSILTYLIDNYSREYIKIANQFQSNEKKVLKLPQKSITAIELYKFLMNPYEVFIDECCGRISLELLAKLKFKRIEKRESYAIYFLQFIRNTVGKAISQFNWNVNHAYKIVNLMDCSERELFRQLELRGIYASIINGRMLWQNLFIKQSEIVHDFNPIQYYLSHHFNFKRAEQSYFQAITEYFDNQDSFNNFMTQFGAFFSPEASENNGEPKSRKKSSATRNDDPVSTDENNFDSVDMSNTEPETKTRTTFKEILEKAEATSSKKKAPTHSPDPVYIDTTPIKQSFTRKKRQSNENIHGQTNTVYEEGTKQPAYIDPDTDGYFEEITENTHETTYDDFTQNPEADFDPEVVPTERASKSESPKNRKRKRKNT